MRPLPDELHDLTRKLYALADTFARSKRPALALEVRGIALRVGCAAIQAEAQDNVQMKEAA